MLTKSSIFNALKLIIFEMKFNNNNIYYCENFQNSKNVPSDVEDFYIAHYESSFLF